MTIFKKNKSIEQCNEVKVLKEKVVYHKKQMKVFQDELFVQWEDINFWNCQLKMNCHNKRQLCSSPNTNKNVFKRKIMPLEE